MLEFTWPWVFLILPLPIVVYRVMSRAPRQEAALYVPFFSTKPYLLYTHMAFISVGSKQATVARRARSTTLHGQRFDAFRRYFGQHGGSRYGCRQPSSFQN